MPDGVIAVRKWYCRPMKPLVEPSGRPFTGYFTVQIFAPLTQRVICGAAPSTRRRKLFHSPCFHTEAMGVKFSRSGRPRLFIISPSGLPLPARASSSI